MGILVLKNFAGNVNNKENTEENLVENSWNIFKEQINEGEAVKNYEEWIRKKKQEYEALDIFEEAKYVRARKKKRFKLILSDENNLIDEPVEEIVDKSVCEMKNIVINNKPKSIEGNN